MANYASGDIIPLWINYDATANAPTAQIRRVSDGYYLDFNDDAFKASAWTTPSVTLTANTTVWSYAWDSASLSTDEAACVIEYTVDGVVYCEELQLNLAASGGGGATAQQVWEYATRTLTSGAAPSAADIADAVWDEERTAHATIGSMGEALQVVVGTVPGLVWEELVADHTGTTTFGGMAPAIHGAAMRDMTGAEKWDCTQPITATFTGTMGIAGQFTIFTANVDKTKMYSYPRTEDITPLGTYDINGWTPDADILNSALYLDHSGYADIIGVTIVNPDFTAGKLSLSITDQDGNAILLQNIDLKPDGGSQRRLERTGKFVSVVNSYLQARDLDTQDSPTVIVDYAAIATAVDNQLSNTHTAGAWGLPRNWRPK